MTNHEWWEALIFGAKGNTQNGKTKGGIMDFVYIDLESTSPTQYLCCEKCLQAYINDTVVELLRCPKCGLIPWRGRDMEDVEHHLQLLEEMKK